MRSPSWLLAGAGDLLAVGLQMLALRWGDVSLVQPLLVLGLPIAVLVAAGLQGQHVTRREWVGIALCTAGVGAVATSTATLLVLVTVLVVAALAGLVAGRRAPALVGAGAGVAAGAGSVALALCGSLASDPVALLADWPPYVAVASGLLALQLGQAAFQHHRLGAPLAAATLAEPAAAVLLSAWVLHEHLVSGLSRQSLTALAVAAATIGVVFLVTEQARTT